MEDIKHTYTIQWVGPLTYDEYKESLVSRKNWDEV